MTQKKKKKKHQQSDKVIREKALLALILKNSIPHSVAQFSQISFRQLKRYFVVNVLYPGIEREIPKNFWA